MIIPSASVPTMYFIGVTTSQSSIMNVFPRWAKELGLGDARLVGMDFVPHDEPARYRDAVAFIKEDTQSRGALVTTHKMDLLAACRDLFDEIDPLAESMAEVSSIFKRDGKLCGRTVDPVNSGRALAALVPTGYWAETGAEVCVLGAGGSSLALTWHLLTQSVAGDRPARIAVTNRSPARLDHMRAFHESLGAGIPVEYHCCPSAEENDRVVSGLMPGSLVVNATGLGKDGPGSPLSDGAVFPRGGMAWDFNYRGDLVFLDQARAQVAGRELRIEDGWIYFIHGWTSVIADVFDLEIPASGPAFDRLAEIAATLRT